MKRIMLKSLMVLSMLVALPAHALDLQDAKSQGLVGEQIDGYIGAVSSAGPEVSQLIDEVNRKRKEAYQNISKENGQPLAVVEKLAAEKLIERLSAGQYYKDGGSWKKR